MRLGTNWQFAKQIHSPCNITCHHCANVRKTYRLKPKHICMLFSLSYHSARGSNGIFCQTVPAVDVFSCQLAASRSIVALRHTHKEKNHGTCKVSKIIENNFIYCWYQELITHECATAMASQQQNFDIMHEIMMSSVRSVSVAVGGYTAHLNQLLATSTRLRQSSGWCLLDFEATSRQ